VFRRPRRRRSGGRSSARQARSRSGEYELRRRVPDCRVGRVGGRGARPAWTRGDQLEHRRLLLQRPVRSMGVVSDVLTQNSFEMSLRDNQDSVETLAADAADPAFRVRLRLRRCNWRADHADAVGAAERIEGFGELDVAVADQDPRVPAFVAQRGEDGARLPCDPGTVRVGGDRRCGGGAVPARGREEDAEAAQPERVDGKEIALDDGRRLLAQELAPLRRSRRGDGSIPWRRRMFHTVLGESVNPSPTSSPWMRL
jgi:hypothetical protein